MPTYLPNPGSSKPPPIWLVRLLSVVLGIGVIIVAVFLGGVILVTGAVLGSGLWLWLWWQRRKMMRMMDRDGVANPGPRNEAAGGRTDEGRPAGGRSERIIEGDFEVVDDNDRSKDQSRRQR